MECTKISALIARVVGVGPPPSRSARNVPTIFYSIDREIQWCSNLIIVNITLQPNTISQNAYKLDRKSRHTRRTTAELPHMKERNNNIMYREGFGFDDMTAAFFTCACFLLCVGVRFFRFLRKPMANVVIVECIATIPFYAAVVFL
eukprot:GEMP01090591.1.p1 GENE.GEMP01090591.1~~GEMP01090591.1.p1  ORF type:complete len:146 (-),score=6.55 GEMP01090591.1:409-846(-)